MSAFNWKLIEEKPDNYLDVRILIEDAVPSTRSENETVYLKQPVSCLRTFVEHYQLEKFFTVPSNTTLKTNKDIIRSENEKRTLVDDFKFFSFDIRNEQGDISYQFKHVEFN